jgi:biopolymer transport protein ExbD
MRRFSQRNSLVTLADINITPLLDLAFVLLIIFIITTPLLEQGINLNLPRGGKPLQKLDPRDIRTIDVSPGGQYKFRGSFQPLDSIIAAIGQEQQRNPNLIVALRGDQNSLYKHVSTLVDRLQHAGVVNISLRTEPPKNR